MGNVVLPNLDDVAEMKDPKRQMEAFINTVGILIKNLSEINGYLNGGNLRANAITTREIKAGAVTADEISAGSVTADKISVNELSAINANLGHITAGLIEAVNIFGSYIATSTGYPRTEMNVLGNFLAAIGSAGNQVALTPQGTGGIPAIILTSTGTDRGFINFLPVLGLTIGTIAGDNFNIQATGNLQINGSNGSSGGFYVSSVSGGPANTYVSFTKGIRTT